MTVRADRHEVIAGTSPRDQSHVDLPTAFDRVSGQLSELIRLFDLGAQAPLIHGVEEAVCGRSLDFPLGGRPTHLSHLNADGSPVQFATAVGSRATVLRFVADPGPLHEAMHDRVSHGYRTLRALAKLTQADAALADSSALLAEIAPENDATLRADPAGAFWIGAAFAAGAAPRMRVYVNGGWGTAASRRARLRRFAAWFVRTREWRDVETRLPAALEPLGLSLTLTPGGETTGAIYLRAFGLRVSDYVALASVAAGPTGGERIRAFGAALLQGSVSHPTPSAALSFHFGPEPGLPTELELCAHCMYRNDTEAQTQLERLFAVSGVDPTPYRNMVRVLAPPVAPLGPPRMHAFIGVQAGSATPAYTVYLNPDLSLADTGLSSTAPGPPPAR